MYHQVVGLFKRFIKNFEKKTVKKKFELINIKFTDDKSIILNSNDLFKKIHLNLNLLLL